MMEGGAMKRVSIKECVQLIAQMNLEERLKMLAQLWDFEKCVKVLAKLSVEERLEILEAAKATGLQVVTDAALEAQRRPIVAILEKTCCDYCPKHGIWYRLSGGTEMRQPEFHAWMLANHGADLDAWDWRWYPVLLGGYAHCESSTLYGYDQATIEWICRPHGDF
jgi:hypothetical protein